MAAFTLEILHAGDFEADGASMARAPKLAAIVDALDDAPHTLVLSAGGNFGTGPFVSAGADPAAGEALTALYDGRFGMPADVDGDGDVDSFSALAPAAARFDIGLMNALGIDASALGNQEFDLGTAVLADAIAAAAGGPLPGDVAWLGAEFPYLAANLDVSKDAALAPIATDAIVETASYAPTLTDLDATSDVPRIAPAAIAVVDGERIGIVGAITQDLAIVTSPGGATVIAPGGGATDVAALAAVLQPTIDALLAQGIDKVILLTHLRDLAVTEAVVPLLSGVDVVVAGGTDAPVMEAFPTVTADAAGNPVLIVAAGASYTELGHLSVQFDDAGRVVVDGSHGTLHPVTDATVASLWGAADPYAPGTKGALVGELVAAATDIVVGKDAGLYGRTDVFLQAPAEGPLREETNLGDLAADADLARAREVDPTVAIAIKNLGGIRHSIGSFRAEEDGSVTRLPPAANPLTGKEAGEISQLDIENALSFNNGLTLLTLTRAQLVAALEYGLEAATDTGQTTGQFPQLSGVALAFDPTLPPGSRIVSAALTDAEGHVTDVLVRDGALVGDAAAPVRIVTIAFLADGGDGYPLPGFIADDPAFADRVDLLGEDEDGDGVLDPGEDLNGNGRLDMAPAIADGVAGFAASGTEQDALADHLARNYATVPYGVADTGPEEDGRLQNLAARDDTVLDGPYALTGTARGDLLAGSAAADTLAGEGGDDTIDGGAAGDLIQGGDGFDQLQGGAGGDFILGGDAPDAIDGGTGDDRLLAGNAGTDRIRGGAGHDLLHGGMDGDSLEGGDGADTLWGDRGDDVLAGGAGPDRFVFAAGHGRDVILDFDPAEDRILLLDDRRHALADTADGAVIAWADGQQVLVPGTGAEDIAALIAFAM